MLPIEILFYALPVIMVGALLITKPANIAADRKFDRAAKQPAARSTDAGDPPFIGAEIAGAVPSERKNERDLLPPRPERISVPTDTKRSMDEKQFLHENFKKIEELLINIDNRVKNLEHNSDRHGQHQ